jgi:hypothetical protein
MDAEAERLVLDSVERFLARDVAPYAQELEAADEYPEEIVARKRELLGSERYPPTYLDDALERTARQNRTLLDGLTEGRHDILVHMIFVLNSVSALDKKSRLNVDIIYADPEKTAGDQLASFGGFFDEAWREQASGADALLAAYIQWCDEHGFDPPDALDPAVLQ